MDHKVHHEIPWREIVDGGIKRSNDVQFNGLKGKYGAGEERTLEQFGAYAGVDFENKKVIHEKRPSKSYQPKGSRKKTQAQKAKTLMKPSDPQDKIYVQIASYRDPDIENTINDLLEKADNPERLIVGVCDQYGPENKHLPVYDKDNFRVIRVPFYSSKGLGWARAMLQTLYFDDAEYTMQLDSHMRFAPSWDAKLKRMLQETGSKKPIISHYCPAFTSKDLEGQKYLLKKSLLKMYCLRFNKTGTVSFRANHVPKDKRNGKPLPSMLVSGHFFFTLGKHINEYRYDPDLYFAGDEVSLAARSWTRGWDIFNPSENVVYHNYSRESRICHWSDQKVGYGELHKDSHKKMRQMLHREDGGFELGQYGLGAERTLEDFEKFSGIDFVNRQLSEKAKEGIFY